MKIKFLLDFNACTLNIKKPLHNLILFGLAILLCFLTSGQLLFAQSLAQGGGGLSESSYAVSADGKVYGWGSGPNDQLGNGSASSTTPVNISESGALARKKIVSVATGRYRALALDAEGNVYSWGENNRILPQQVAGLSGITAIAVGLSHSLALKSDGSVYAWGFGGDGQLGTGIFNDKYEAFSSSTPLLVGISEVIAISAGSNHSLALTSDGTVYFWGASVTAVPLKVNTLTEVAAIASGYNHFIALKSDGTVYTWGSNDAGELGNGTNISSQVPVKVINLSGVRAIAAGSSHSLAIKSDGTVYNWGYDGISKSNYTPVQVTGLSDITAIAGGLFHSLALKSDGRVYSWGSNRYSQLGNGTTTDSAVPVQAAVQLGTATATPVLSLSSSIFYAGQKVMINVKTNNYQVKGKPIAQLSDATGSFNSPVNIGTSLGYSGNYFQFSGTISANTPPGSGYRIRVIDSNAGVIVSNNGADLHVIASPANISWQILEDFEQSNSWPWSPWSAPGDIGNVSGTLNSAAAHSGNYGISIADWAQRTDVSIGATGDKISMWAKDDASLGFLSSYLQTYYFGLRGNRISFHSIPGYLDYSWQQLVAAEFNAQPGKWYRLEVTFIPGFIEGRVYDSDGVTELAYLKSKYANSGGSGSGSGIAIRGVAVDDISYSFVPQSLVATSALSGNVFNKGQAIAVPFAANGNFRSWNTFTAQLSDAAGNFNAPVDIGTIAGTTSGTIDAIIPANTPAGNNYRIRVISYDPVVVGTDNGVNLTIKDLTCSLALTSKVTQAEPWYGMWGAFSGAGSIDLSVSGGTAPYTYRWNAGLFTQDIPAASPGKYVVTVTDAKGCMATTTVYVGRKNGPLTLAASPINVSGTGQHDGSIDLSVMGGVVPATYRWSNGAITEDITNLAAGTYTVVVTDAFGRTATLTVQVLEPGTPRITTTKKPTLTEIFAEEASGLAVYPNPTKNNTTIALHLPVGAYSLELYDIRGAKVKTLATGKATADKTVELKINVDSYSKGIYLLRLITDKGISSKRLIIER
ncbi:MAG: T9SS type A sorting domain-containing protein [Adhaeribacter sp.]